MSWYPVSAVATLARAVAGTGLRKMDGKHAPDPYVVASVEGAPQMVPSSIRSHTQDPVWGDMLMVNVPDQSKRLMLDCYDSDAGGTRQG